MRRQEDVTPLSESPVWGQWERRNVPAEHRCRIKTGGMFGRIKPPDCVNNTAGSSMKSLPPKPLAEQSPSGE
jgi:hypothetical protein